MARLAPTSYPPLGQWATTFAEILMSTLLIAAPRD
jgi:hypothetical protein